DAWFEDHRGEPCEYLAQGQHCVCKVRVEFNSEVEAPTFALAIESDKGARVFATSTAWVGETTGSFRAGEQVIFSVSFENFLAPGRYYATPHVVLLEGPGAGIVDRRDRATAVVITGDAEEGSLVNVPHDLSVERIAAKELS